MTMTQKMGFPVKTISPNAFRGLRCTIQWNADLNEICKSGCNILIICAKNGKGLTIHSEVVMHGA
jgi:hypothetical protein